MGPLVYPGGVTVLALGLELVLDTALSSISLLLQQKQIQCYMLGILGIQEVFH